MTRSTPRSLRIAELVKREISNLLMTLNDDPRISQAVVTDARSKRHTAQVTIYVYPSGSVSSTDMLAGLNEYKPMLRKKLGMRLKMRYVPDIAFVYDETIDSSQRIEAILSRNRIDRHASEGEDTTR